jgi:NADH pyrophosphatase NudC (nudix superfamily)
VVVELINRRITEETALEHLKDRIDENKFCPNCGAKMEKSEG